MPATGRFTPADGEGAEKPATLLSPEMAAFASVAGGSGHPVLIAGETGCGKTHLARLIHAAGPRRSRPFVRVNCASIPDTLFEREMFGHVRGAYTDARSDASGFLEAANGGTLFLDEIGELSLHMQPKLLAVLEDGCYRRLGSPRELRVDAQVIAATHRDLAALVRERKFRQDLFYRLSVLRYHVRPLRERRSEIPVLAEALLSRAAPHGGAVAITEEAMRMVVSHSWPGIIRELENALRSAAAFSRGEPIEPHHLPSELRDGGRGSAPESPPERYAASGNPEEEARTIRAALAAAGWNKTLAAQRLGMSRSTLWAKLQRHDLRAPAGDASLERG
jgi:DNA-binding NtrC family response regulator